MRPALGLGGFNAFDLHRCSHVFCVEALPSDDPYAGILRQPQYFVEPALGVSA